MKVVSFYLSLDIDLLLLLFWSRRWCAQFRTRPFSSSRQSMCVCEWILHNSRRLVLAVNIEQTHINDDHLSSHRIRSDQGKYTGIWMVSSPSLSYWRETVCDNRSFLTNFFTQCDDKLLSQTHASPKSATATLVSLCRNVSEKSIASHLQMDGPDTIT